MNTNPLLDLTLHEAVAEHVHDLLTSASSAVLTTTPAGRSPDEAVRPPGDTSGSRCPFRLSRLDLRWQ